MNNTRFRQHAIRFCHVFILLSVLVLNSGPVLTAESQEVVPISGGGGKLDTGNAKSLAATYFNFQYLLLKQTVALWSDGRGDVILERNIRNVGTASGTSTTWYFDWYPGEYSNIRAWDVHGPLQYSTTQSGTRIYVTVEFRQPVLPNQTYDFSLAITINDMAYGSGNDWEAYWYTYPGFPVQEFVQGVTFPSNSIIQNAYPTPTTQNLNYLEWKYTNTPANWSDSIDVFYTLGNSIGVPLFRQTDEPWWRNTYGNYPDGDTYNTIKRWGCWMTSAAMIIEYWGQRSSPTFHTDPGILNTWLRNNNGYDKDNGVIHSAIAKYATDSNVSLYYQGQYRNRNDIVLDDYLSSGNPVIIRVTNQWGYHFVLATGKTTVGGQATYSINDPDKGETTLLEYNNDYSAIILYSGTSADPRTLRISAHSPVELLVTDPLGRKSGFDPTTNTNWDEIPDAVYIVESLAPDDGSNTPALKDKYLEIVAPLDGDYAIDVIGTGEGSYEIDVFASDWFGRITKKVYTGVAEDGSIDTENTYFSSYSGIGVPIVPYILRASINPSSVASVDFTVFFSTPVTGVDIGDFALTTTGVTGAGITGVSGSGTTYTVTVNTGSGNGTIHLDVVDDDSIKDLSNNPLGGVGLGNGNFTSGETYTIAKPANITVTIGGNPMESYSLTPGESTRQSYTGVDNGPAQIKSTNGVPILGAMRAIWLKNGQFNSYSELMGLPKEQLSTEYWFPWYNNAVPSLLDEQFRFANADTTPTTIEVSVGSTLLETYNLDPGESVRDSYPGLDNGPIRIRSTDNKKIIAAMRAVWIVGGQHSSYSELMGLPKEQLSTEYWFPWYNNAVPSLLDEQFRFANVDTTPTTIEVSVGSTVLESYNLDPGESVRDSYPGLDNGPIRIRSTDNKKIIAAMRAVWLKNGQFNSYSELMGLPKEQLSTEYLFPWYNNAAPSLLDEQFRFANVDATPTTIEVLVGSTSLGTYDLDPGESWRQSYPGLDNGPIRIRSVDNKKIIAAMRAVWIVGGQFSSYSELMGLPKELLSAEYWFPWYNNAVPSLLDEQFRFGVP